MARRAADAITNLAHENVPIKSCVRAEGGIDPLVHLLESFDAKVLLTRGLFAAAIWAGQILSSTSRPALAGRFCGLACVVI